MTRYVMVIDQRRCIGCHSCTVACRTWNELPLDIVYNPESGWLIDPENGDFHEMWYGWRYDGATGDLVDDATGTHYTMSYEPVAPAVEEAPAEEAPAEQEAAAGETAEKEEE